MRRPPEATLRLATALLRLCVVCQCLGNAWWFGVVGETPVGSLLWNAPETGGLGWSESAVASLHQSLALLWLVAAGVVAMRPTKLVLGTLVGLQVAIAAAKGWTHSGFQLDTSWLPFEGWLPFQGDALRVAFPFFSQSARVAGPLALIPLLGRGADRWQATSSLAAAAGPLRWATVATFAAHGLEALQHYHVFCDMILVATRGLLAAEISQATAEAVLTWIGIADVLVASAAAVWRSPTAAGYMAAWGLITAASRVVVYGVAIGGWGFATRVPHAVLPLVLLLVWLTAADGEATPESQPEPDPADA